MIFNDLDFNIMDEVINESCSIDISNDVNSFMIEYEEFCNEYDLFNEAVKGGVQQSRNVVSRAYNKAKENVKGTIKTTSQIGKAYSDTTTAGAIIIKSSFNLALKSVSIANKAFTLMAKIIAAFPDVLLKTINTIEKLPENISATIRGSMDIFITENDLNLFSKQIFPDINKFENAALKLLNESNWNDDFLSSTTGAISTMMKQYQLLGKVSFEKTKIALNADTINMYLNNKSNWYTESNKIYENIQSHMKDIKNINDLLTKRIPEGKLSDDLKNIKNPKNQEKLVNAIRMISNIIAILAKFINCLYTDMQEVQKAGLTIKNKYKASLDQKQSK